MSSCSKQVLEVLSLYLQAPGKSRVAPTSGDACSTNNRVVTLSYRCHPCHPGPSVCLPQELAHRWRDGRD